MEILKILIFLCCTYCAIASHQSHTIPIEGYETKLEDLGQHVEIPETPVKVIKITKTIAVKIPVPYPVKVKEKVPYPVHIAKPYPVPVPQIIKVPHISTPSQHGHERNDALFGNHINGNEGNTYQVQETGHDAPSGADHSFEFISGNPSGDDVSFEASPGSSYNSNSFQGHTGSLGSAAEQNDESKSYDQAIKDYFNKQQPNVQSEENGYNYH
ncbi:hypothetical protein ACJJTC_014243 [Scirpophaga incertulas]